MFYRWWKGGCKLEKEPKSQDKSKKIVRNIKDHLEMKIGIPVGILLIILVLALVRVPYTAKESYTENETKVRIVTTTEIDTKNPVWEKVCTDVPAKYTVEEDSFSPFIRAVGKNFECFAKFRVWNIGNSVGKWTYYYSFNVSGRVINKDPVTIEIQPLASVWFEFVSDQCTKADTLTGTYQYVSGPTVSECKNTEVYKNITVNREESYEVPSQRERIITKYEPLWQRMIGYNNFEKV
jgi:hypothetical protein